MAEMTYQRVGASGVRLPAISLGLWHNFGSEDSYRNARAMVPQAQRRDRRDARQGAPAPGDRPRARRR
jgi:hypothetical protein